MSSSAPHRKVYGLSSPRIRASTFCCASSTRLCELLPAKYRTTLKSVPSDDVQTVDETARQHKTRNRKIKKKTTQPVDMMDMAMRRFGPEKWRESGFRCIDETLQTQALHEVQEKQGAKQQKEKQSGVAKLRGVWDKIAGYAPKSEADQLPSPPPSSSLGQDYVIDIERAKKNPEDVLGQLVELRAQYRDIVHATLTWRKVFVTKRGFTGMGPAWLSDGDSVILVPGADVPFILARAERSLQQEERAIRGALDKNADSYSEA